MPVIHALGRSYECYLFYEARFNLCRVFALPHELVEPEQDLSEYDVSVLINELCFLFICIDCQWSLIWFLISVKRTRTSTTLILWTYFIKEYNAIRVHGTSQLERDQGSWRQIQLATRRKTMHAGKYPAWKYVLILCRDATSPLRIDGGTQKRSSQCRPRVWDVCAIKRMRQKRCNWPGCAFQWQFERLANNAVYLSEILEEHVQLEPEQHQHHQVDLDRKFGFELVRSLGLILIIQTISQSHLHIVLC